MSLFFQREKNLLTFLRRAITREELRAVKLELLQFLQRFIETTGKKILPYAVDIKDACIAVFKMEKFANVRCFTLTVVANLLELASGNGDVARQMNLKKVAEEYFLALVSQSKLTPSGTIN